MFTCLGWYQTCELRNFYLCYSWYEINPGCETSVVLFVFSFAIGIIHILQIEIYVGLKLFWTKVTGSNPLLPNA